MVLAFLVAPAKVFQSSASTLAFRSLDFTVVLHPFGSTRLHIGWPRQLNKDILLAASSSEEWDVEYGDVYTHSDKNHTTCPLRVESYAFFYFRFSTMSCRGPASFLYSAHVTNPVTGHFSSASSWRGTNLLSRPCIISFIAHHTVLQADLNRIF